MKTIILVFILSSCALKVKSQVDYDRQVENLALEASKKIDTTKKYKIGILEFVSNDKIVTQLGEILADDISAELANLSSSTSKFEVLERSRLDQIFKEKNLLKSYDSKDATELGKINAVNILIIGTIVQFGDYYKLTIKLLDSKTGSVLSSVKGQLAKTQALDNLYQKKNHVLLPSNIPKENDDISQPHDKTNSENGWAEFENLTENTLAVFISQDQAVQTYPSSTKSEQFTIPSQTKEKMPSLKPGVYYLCSKVNGILGDLCMITKKFEIIAGQKTAITLKY